MKPLGVIGTGAVFGAGAVGLYLATRPLMTVLVVAAKLRPDVSWFVSGSLLFAALGLCAAFALHAEGERSLGHALEARCRFNRMQRGDWAIATTATLLVLICTGGLQLVLTRFVPGFTPHPPFLKMAALAPSERWVLLAWLPMFALNIAGEELLWHGYLLPRNEIALGHRAWLVNAAGWLLFHVPFGVDILLLLWPMMLIETYAIQRSRNTWVGVVVHAAVNGPAFVAISLGWIG